MVPAGGFLPVDTTIGSWLEPGPCTGPPRATAASPSKSATAHPAARRKHAFAAKTVMVVAPQFGWLTLRWPLLAARVLQKISPPICRRAPRSGACVCDDLRGDGRSSGGQEVRPQRIIGHGAGGRQKSYRLPAGCRRGCC